MELLKPVEKYGERINIIIPLNEKSRSLFFKKEIRFMDILFYFLRENYIEISVDEVEKILHETIEEVYEDELRLPLGITFKKSIKEISNIEDTWISYGNDLKLNLLEHVAYNKNNFYKFRSNDSKYFRLLRLLIESKGIPILIVKTYSELYPEDTRPEKEDFPTKKNQVNYLIKNLRKELKIKHNNNSAVRIQVSGKEICLISNTP